MPYTLLSDDEPSRGYRLLDDQPTADPKLGQPEELTFAEKYIAPLLEGAGLDSLSKVGVSRGGAVGRLAMGAAEPGAAAVQHGAHLFSGPGQTTVTKAIDDRIADVEKQYQTARAEEGSTGLDPLRTAGSVGMTFMVPGATALKGTGVLTGAASGVLGSALQPVTSGDFWTEKAKQEGGGALAGAALGPLLGAISRVVSPNASVNPQLKLLREEGIDPSIGQSLGGWANKLEEQAQSIPAVGSVIQSARQRGAGQLEDAAYRRAAEPIGATIEARGNEGIKELSGKIGAEYDRILPKLSVNVLDDGFVNRMANLRSMVQTLPQAEREYFDGVIAREIDDRVMPNGALSGQALKDAWVALREGAKKFSNSTDGYQRDLGAALKQALAELKDHATASNNPSDVLGLRAADFAYAHFKRLQRASGMLGAEEGHFTPSQFQNAVKAMDTSKDKARFAEGGALMQDLSAAGKKILANKEPDSGTAGRWLLGSLLMGGAGMAGVGVPAVAGGAAAAAAYTKHGQDALRYLLTQRPGQAPAVANYIRQLLGPAALAGGAMVGQ